MSNNIEDEIVSMQFDNKQFESGVATSLGTIDKLKGSLAFPDAGKGLADINTAVGRFNMNPMSSAIQGVSKLWLGLTTVAVTAISNITNRAVDAGINLAKSFTIDPITQGFQEYEKNLNSIQTIMANTGKNVNVVNGYLNQLNHYSDQTIYNFGQMADSIGKFTAAGVPLKDATSSIKGLANTAALSGSDVNQLNTAMYQMSQALSTGTIRLMDWNSLANAGMGGENIRKALEASAHSIDGAGSAMDAALAKAGNFRDSLQAGWLTADIFNKTMKVMAGTTNKAGKTVAFSVKQLQGMGYSLQAAKDLNKLSAAAINSATKVKTFTQLIDVVKESIGSGWSMVFQNLFGNFNQATKLWTGVSNSITGAVSRIFKSINKVLVGWRDLGGYQDLWTGIKNIFIIMGNVIRPFVDAFKAVLPSTGKAGSGLAKLTKGFADFTGFLVKVTDKMYSIEPVLEFVFKAFKTGYGYLSATAGALKPLLPLFEDLAKYIGDLSQQGKEIAEGLIGGLFEGLNAGDLRDQISAFANNIIVWIKDTLGIHSPASTMVPIGLNIVQGIVEGIGKAAQFMIVALQKIFIGLGKVVKAASENISWSDVLDTINTGLFLGVVLLFKKFVGTFDGIVGAWKQVMGSAGGVLDQLKNNLKTMQNEVKSEIIRNIAISVALLAGSALLLSTIDGKKLGVALGAIAGLMTSLVLAMRTITGGGKGKVDVKSTLKQMAVLNGIATALIGFSTAVLILTGAVAIMGQLDTKTIERGLAGITGVIAVITAATAILGKTGGGATIIATATALLIMSAALVVFVKVMKIYEKLDWDTIKQGGGKAALIIAGVALAMRAFGKNAISGAIGMTIAAGALLIIAKALQQLASIGLGDMIKSVLALIFVIDSLVVAAEVISKSPGGAMGLLLMSGAIIVLAKALQILSKIPFWDLVKAVGAIALAMIVLGGTAAALSELAPLVSAFGLALLLVGGAIFLAGTGVLAFATAMGILAVVGPAAFQALHDGISDLLDVLPKIGEALGAMVVSFFTGLVKAAGPLAKALGKLLGILLDELTKLIPKLQRLMQKAINALIDVIFHSQQHAAKAMIKFILNLLDALADGVPKMIKKGTDLIVGVITGLAKADVRIANATGHAILTFLRGLDKAINKYAEPIGAAGRQIAIDLATGLAHGLLGSHVWNMIENAAKALAGALPGWMKKILGINSPSRVMRDEIGKWAALGVAEGLSVHSKSVEKASTDVADNALKAMKLTFANSKNAASGLGDLHPKVTPVLDLTRMSDAASQISAKMGSHSVDLGVSRRQARDVASIGDARNGSGGHGESGDVYNFNQTITSPKPVSPVKVYRGTKSQIALFKEVTRK